MKKKFNKLYANEKTDENDVEKENARKRERVRATDRRDLGKWSVRESV